MTAPTETDRPKSAAPATVRDPGSYRDPGGFVYRRDGVLHRQIDPGSIDDWNAFLAKWPRRPPDQGGDHPGSEHLERSDRAHITTDDDPATHATPHLVCERPIEEDSRIVIVRRGL